MVSAPGTDAAAGRMARREFVLSTAGAMVSFATGCRGGGADPSLGSRYAHRASLRGDLRLRFLVNDPAFAYSRPCFAPSGDTVLFMRAPLTAAPPVAQHSDLSRWSLWTVPLAGGPMRPLFDDPVIRATRPDWSWRTGRVAFTGIRDGGEAALLVLDPESGAVQDVPVGRPPRSRVYYPSWYPEGDSIAVTDYSARQVLKVEILTGRVEPLTDPRVLWAGMASVSPITAAGNPLAVAGQAPGGRYDSSGNAIWVQYPSRVPVRIDREQGRMPAWSPDGNRLAFASTRGRMAPSYLLHPRRLPGGMGAIWVRSGLSGGNRGAPVPVTPFGCGAAHAKWSPDGARLVCMVSSIDGEERGIAVVEVPPAA